MAKRQKKSGASKKRQKKYRPKDKTAAPSGPETGGGGGGSAPRIEDEYGSTGAMGNMLGGFRRAVGVAGEDEKKRRKNPWLDHVWTALLILAVGAILFWRFGMD